MRHRQKTTAASRVCDTAGRCAAAVPAAATRTNNILSSTPKKNHNPNYRGIINAKAMRLGALDRAKKLNNLNQPTV